MLPAVPSPPMLLLPQPAVPVHLATLGVAAAAFGADCPFTVPATKDPSNLAGIHEQLSHGTMPSGDARDPRGTGGELSITPGRPVLQPRWSRLALCCKHPALQPSVSPFGYVTRE